MDDQQTDSKTTFSEPNGVLPQVQQVLPPDPALSATAGQAAPAMAPPASPVHDGALDDNQSAYPAQQPATALPALAPEAAEEAKAPQTVPDSRALVPVPEEAGDGDLIEKEWVVKAKQIVEHTAEDPYKQQEELNKIRADYMKKRYNKDLGTV